MNGRVGLGQNINHPLKIVLFDLGGTLIYFDGVWPVVYHEGAKALLKSLHQLGYTQLGAGFAEEFYSGLQNYYVEREVDLVEHTTRVLLRSMLERYECCSLTDDEMIQVLSNMYSVSQVHWRLEEDTLPMLETLRSKGYRLGVISNAADDDDVQTLIDQHQLREYFEIVLVSAAVGLRKPHPRMFEMALDYFHAAANEAVMVGDTLEADILGAKRSGLHNVWITRRVDRANCQPLDDSIRPDIQIDTLAELPQRLLRLKMEIGQG